MPDLLSRGILNILGLYINLCDAVLLQFNAVAYSSVV